jgi:PPOX class probable F420-dependent enzyme
MRRNLTVDDLGDLVGLPLLAVLATYRPDGTVLLSPVWHEWRNGGFEVVTGSRDVKAAHLRRDPRASIVVCEHSPPYRGVELRGRARLVTAGVGDEPPTRKEPAMISSFASNQAIYGPGTSPTGSEDARHRRAGLIS